MVIDSFKQKQRNLLLELADNYEHVMITEVSDILNTTDVNVKINFRLISDKEKFINDFGLLVKEGGL
jgi:hypothetical protein